MSFEFIKKLPTPEEIRNQYPVDAEIQALKEKRDTEIRDIFTGKSDKVLAIIGPCSADNEDAVQQVKDTREWFISRILRRNRTFLQV